jgi:hypothetical protein
MSEKDLDLLMEIIGWTGSIEILLAYGLNSYQKIRSDSPTFLLLNLTGALFLIVYTFYEEAFASTFLNLVWVIIAVFALGKWHRDRTAKKTQS